MRNKGFTLMELMVTLSVLAVLASLAIPAYQNTVKSNQLAACANKLVSAVQFAKSEAITKRTNISVALSSDPDSSVPVYDVGIDTNVDGSLDELLQTLRCDSPQMSVSVTDDRSFVTFGPTGFRVDGSGLVEFTTCNDIGQGRVLSVSQGGGVSNSDGSCS